MTNKEAITNIEELKDTFITCYGEENTVAVSLDGTDIQEISRIKKL